MSILPEPEEELSPGMAMVNSSPEGLPPKAPMRKNSGVQRRKSKKNEKIENFNNKKKNNNMPR